MKRARTAFALALALLGLAAAPAHAQDYFDDLTACDPSDCVIVDSTADELDAEVGDGRCETKARRCTLRAAVQESNHFREDGIRRIALPAGHYRLTRHGADEDAAATGDLDVRSVGVSIVGSGMGETVVDGDRADRVFQIWRSNTTLAHMTVRGGRVHGSGGGVLVPEHNHLRHLEVMDNEALTATGPQPDSGPRGGPPGYGGGVDAYDAAITDSFIHDNSAVHGGGLHWHGAQSDFARLTLSHNYARESGGGLLFDAYDASFSNLTVFGNGSDGRGGGIAFHGGGYWFEYAFGVTVFANTAPAAGGIWWQPDSDGSARVGGLLVAQNGGSDCGGGSGAFESAGGNIDTDGSCGFGAAGDRTVSDPKLGTLQDNGGPTPTNALLAGSPAIDAWPCSPGRGLPSSDQRGALRPQGSACDSGAYEAGACCAAFAVPKFEAKKDEPGRGPGSDPGPGPDPNPNPAGPGPCGARLLGTPKADRLPGDELRNDIAGRAGNDTILGLGGDDCLFGNAGNDVLKGGPGADRLSGDSGHDRLVGGDGNDTVKAGPGNDVVDARGKGFDRIDCGPGRDKALVGDLDRVRNCERVLNVD